jgi:hypothetical protein
MGRMIQRVRATCQQRGAGTRLYDQRVHRVLVVGTPRGGTTWVAQTLARGRGVTYIHEPDGAHEPFAFRARRIDGVAHYPILRPGDTALQWTRLWNGVFSGGRVARSPRELLARRAFAGVSGADKRRAADGAPTTRLRIAEALARPRQPDPAVGTVLAKSVNSALAAPWIYEHWRPAVVVVRRDLRNVLASWGALGLQGPRPAVFELVAAEARRRWDIELSVADDEFARAASLCAVMALALHDDAAVYGWTIVDHEAACRDATRELRAAATAVGIEWTDDATAFVRESNQEGTGYQTRRVASELPDAWRSKLSSEQLRTIDAVLACLPEDRRTIPVRG